MPIAFKEWAVTVRALAEGEQLLTLRKGGIREPEKHFKLDHERFFLYPTFDHQRPDLVRQSHRPELMRALEEGVWADDEPAPDALFRGVEVTQPDRVRIRAWVEVASPSFKARHDSAHRDDAAHVLHTLELARRDLADYFPIDLAGLTVVLHDGTASLWMAAPLLPAAWLATSPASRRYLAGWAGAAELHLLSPAALKARASSVPGSREM